MIKKIGSIILKIIAFGVIIWLIFFSDYSEIVTDSIGDLIGLLFLLAIILWFLWMIFTLTHKWLTVGLDEKEKDGAVIILAIIIYGIIMYSLYRFISPHFEDIESFFLYLIKIIVGTFIILIPLNLVYNRTLKSRISDEKRQSIIFLFIIIISFIISITIEHFYGDIIVKWLENNWYYVLIGYLVIGSIFMLVEKKNNPTSK